MPPDVVIRRALWTTAPANFAVAALNNSTEAPAAEVVEVKVPAYLKGDAANAYRIGAEVYARDKAEALEADLLPLVGGEIVTHLSKHDTNPANNPQPPERYRK